MKSRVSGQCLEGTRSKRKNGVPGSARAKPLPLPEMRFRRLFEAASDGILILDAVKHKILEANPFLSHLVGRPRKELVGQDPFEAGILTRGRTGRQAMARLRRRGFARFDQEVANARTGERREFEFLCNVYEEGGRSLIQCNIRDLTGRRNDERRLREALQQAAAARNDLETRVHERTADLQQRNAELEAFSYSLSHDLRAPIRAIVSFTQIALDEFGAQLGPQGTELLERAIQSAQRLDQLITDVLSFSRTTRHRALNEKVDVDKLVREIIRERPEWNSPRAEVAVEHPLLPVRGDRASLTQCLTNLIDNAVKFVPAGILAQVRVYAQPVGRNVRLYVEDNGIGIPLSAQSRVFELFQRAHNGYEGHGIGLAIVRRAAERMGGTVGLQSQPSRGSKFWIELPQPVPPAKPHQVRRHSVSR